MTSLHHQSLIPDDDDEDRWEPLEQEECAQGAPVVSLAHHLHQRCPASSSRRTRIHGTAKDEGLDLRMLQRKLEMKSKLKEGLVDNPLDQAWQRFLAHLGRELWELDLCARLGTYVLL